MSLEFDTEINLGTILTIIILIVGMAGSYAWIQSDVKKAKQAAEAQREFRQEVRQNYITREQLHYMVLERFDRFESNVEIRFERLEELIKEEREQL